MGYPLDSFPTQVRLHGGLWSAGSTENRQNIWHLEIKTKRNLSELNSENEAADFPRFIVIESLEEVCLAKFSLAQSAGSVEYTDCTTAEG